MSRNPVAELSKFFVVGVNYKKTDTLIRGSFAVSSAQYEQILQNAAGFGVHDLFVLSTCNRSEIYGLAENPGQLVRLLCSQTEGSEDTFNELAYCKEGLNAIRHLFDVAAGLDSQILGDYEIVGQIRQAVKFARERKFIHTFLERTLNQVLQSSKDIKNQTALSDGTVSVAFAAVHYIRDNIQQVKTKNILLLGTGKIGSNACKNMVDYLGTTKITLINRTNEKAEDLASALNLRYASMDQLPEEIKRADIILVATNAADPVIRAEQLESLDSNKLIIDLSIPCNVDKSVALLSSITLIDVDSLSRTKDETLQRRAGEVPKAEAIIAGHMRELLDWHEMRKHVPVLREVKIKLQEIYNSPLFEQPVPARTLSMATDQKIQRVLNGMASKMRRENQRGCQYIQAINEFIAGG
ncbi:MAG TPA: glutamyl-tRNA reductase [Puia sp.]|jgi:glutamyl-tRNA reductase